MILNDHQAHGSRDTAVNRPGTHLLTGAAGASGSTIVKVVPAPTVESIRRVPPALVMIPYTVARPSPVPTPAGLVVKKGSKARSITSLSMPAPVSATCSRTAGPGGTPGNCESPTVTSTFSVLMGSAPQSASWSRAV